MSAYDASWDHVIFSDPANEDFLDDMARLDEPEDVIEALADTCLLGAGENPGDDELLNAQCAATIVAIWAGATYSSGEIVEEYPFIRRFIGTDLWEDDERLRRAALHVLENVSTDHDVDVFVEALDFFDEESSEK